MKLRLGTRGSPLALIQTNMVIDGLRALAPDVESEVVIIKTEGDLNRRESLTALGGRGVFVREIEERLLAGEIDAAVHSLKDLPAATPDALCIAAIPQRADARDVLVTRSGSRLGGLPQGARVGSSSQRRSAQLLAMRPDLQIADIRGNVDTRLRKLDAGDYDAIVLAAAGLERMGLASRISHAFTPDEMLPSPGQGALAVECRVRDADVRAKLALLDHGPTRVAVTAERAFLRGLGGGCQLPIGALAVVNGASLQLRGMVASPDGRRRECEAIDGPAADADRLGVTLAERVLARGVAEMLIR